MLSSHVYYGCHWLGSKCGTWPVEYSHYPSIQRAFSLPCFNFQHVNIILFHLLFLILLPVDFLCRNEVSVCRYRSRKSMVCHCVAHQKLIELCHACHALLSPAVFLQYPSSPSRVVSNTLLIGFPSTPVLCITVSAKTGISIRHCPLWLTFKQTSALTMLQIYS